MDDLQKKFSTALNKFAIHEYAKVIHFVFEDLFTWEDVKLMVDSLKLRKRKKTIVETCCLIYQRTSPSEKDATEKLMLLQLCDVALHNTRDWFAIKMTEPFPDSPPSLSRIEKHIKRAYKKEIKNALVFKLVTQKLIWLMIVEEQVKRERVKHLKPVFLVYNVGLKEPYALYTPKLSANYPIELVSAAFGYQAYSSLTFVDKDPRNLFNLVKNKHKKTVALKTSLPLMGPVVDGCIVDRTMHRMLGAYAQRVLPGSTNFTTYTVDSVNEWQGITFVPNLTRTAKQVKTTLVIRASKNSGSVEEVLRQMIMRRNLDVPVPSWVENFTRAPTNVVDLQLLEAFGIGAAEDDEESDS